jgi:dolichyl-phosphate beta-glucosyltransferase
MNLSLIIPAYNEALRIAGTVQSAVDYFVARGIQYEIIIAADGDDGTREIVTGMGKVNPNIRVIGNIQRSGKGFGIRQAVVLAKGDIIGFADADDKSPITELDKFLPHFLNGADLVIGSRGQRESIIERAQPLYRQVGSRGFGILMHLIVGLWDISDTQCGFKFFRSDVAKELFARQKIDGYMFDVEILYLAQLMGYHTQQVPVRWRDDGDSRLDLIAGNIRNVQDLIKIRLTDYR